MINKKEWLKKKVTADKDGMPPTNGSYLQRSYDYWVMTRSEAFERKGLSVDQIDGIYNEYTKYKKEHNEEKTNQQN